jgi:hypothetical protein
MVVIVVDDDDGGGEVQKHVYYFGHGTSSWVFSNAT